jgi:hypothetical protein
MILKIFSNSESRTIMIVLIDDERTFKKSVISEEYILLKTSGEAFLWLESLSENSRIDQLWFDHDLGMVNGIKETVINFVRRLEVMCFEGNAPDIRQVIVHTSNSVGGDEIVNSMKRYFPTVRVSAKDYLLGPYNRVTEE